ncbi:hypothetical protein PLESTM_000516700 [Pleodorina starrii]|nr:hypothetical protein PLESTM_000516700 [Pleodorina starrii]
MNLQESNRAKCALLVLCGLPGSGKTTLAKAIREHLLRHHEPFLKSGPFCDVQIVTFDDWLHPELQQLAGQFSADAWQRSRQAALAHLLSALERAQSNASHTLIIADDNHHLRSMRYELFRAARDRGAAFLQLYVGCSPQQALARNQRRSGIAAVPPEALLRMAAALEPPQPERFPWEAPSLTASAAAVSPAPDREQGQTQGHPPDQQQLPEHDPLDKQETVRPDTVAGAICTALWRLWGPPPPPPPTEAEVLAQREAGRAANAASHLHGLDLRSRRALGAAVAAAPPADRAAIGRHLNERRRALLQAARELLQHLPLPPQAPQASPAAPPLLPPPQASQPQAGAGEGEGQGGASSGADGGGEDAADGGDASEENRVVLERLRELEAAFMRAAGLGKEAETETEAGSSGGGGKAGGAANEALRWALVDGRRHAGRVETDVEGGQRLAAASARGVECSAAREALAAAGAWDDD